MLDSQVCLNAGKIFIWNHYPFCDHEEKNRRWFLCLGSSIIQELLFQVTTTTKLEYYQPLGKREKNNFFKLKAGMGGLEQDCIVDLTLYYEKRTHHEINEHKKNIDPKDLLKQEQINTLVNHLVKDRNIIRIEKKSIYQYLRDSGFSVRV